MRGWLDKIDFSEITIFESLLFYSPNILTSHSSSTPESSIYKYLEKELGLNITHSRREISFRYATEEEKQHMDLGEYNMVAVVESITYLSNGNILQYGILTYRPDKFTFVTMAKR